MDGQHLPLVANAQAAMTRVPDLATHLAEYALELMQMQIAWDRVAEQTVQNLAMPVIHVALQIGCEIGAPTAREH
jgi:hypothetical protein